jgi:hypothetical protein
MMLSPEHSLADSQQGSEPMTLGLDLMAEALMAKDQGKIWYQHL